MKVANHLISVSYISAFAFDARGAARYAYEE